MRAHLDNFIIMIIPSQTVSPSTSSPGLLDFLTKSFPKASYFKRFKHVKKQKPDPLQEETISFIESKTAPYHVDLSQSSTDVIKAKDDIVLASSPSLTVVKPEATRTKRSATHYVLAIPAEEGYVSSRHVDPKSAIRKHKKTIKEKGKRREELKLLGAENEQCGPGMVRDSYGICVVLTFI